MAQAWVLSSEASINTIRNALVQKLGKLDTLFIVDAAHDKAAWFNFGPESDTRIRKMWSRPAEYTGAEKRAARRGLGFQISQVARGRWRHRPPPMS